VIASADAPVRLVGQHLSQALHHLDGSFGLGRRLGADAQQGIEHVVGVDGIGHGDGPVVHRFAPGPLFGELSPGRVEEGKKPGQPFDIRAARAVVVVPL
jgi:hypothetical protein